MTKMKSAGSTVVSTLIGDPVFRVSETTPLRRVADALTGAEIGIVIVGEGKTIAGVVSERDVTRAVADGLDPEGTRAIDVAHTTLIWCDASATVAQVATEMMSHWVRHVLVEEDGHLVGIVSAPISSASMPARKTQTEKVAPAWWGHRV